tara:strand:+ start:806 stop:1657 length:852 start_codon:yes stop_codon:yes gene_type:complete
MTLVLQVSETTATGYREGWESAQVSRNFTVRNSLEEPEDTDDLATAIELHDGRSAIGVPVLGEAHPQLGWACTNVSADYADANYPHVVQIVAEYRQTLPTVGAVNFTQIQVQPQLEYVDTYKKDVPIPSRGQVTTANEVIADGNCVGSGGYPVSTSIVSGTLTITYDQTGLPYWFWLVGQAGRRNSVDFIGFNAGSLLYMGPSLRRTGSVVSSFEDENMGTYEITHAFRFDEWLHCRQYANINSEIGLPLTDTDGCVADLKWIQGHSDFVDFWNFGIPGLDEL